MRQFIDLSDSTATPLADETYSQTHESQVTEHNQYELLVEMVNLAASGIMYNVEEMLNLATNM